ncbi:MAG: tetratricopeptide repeat-containing glycosyltransferase family protein [Candidatus Dependentiae bacterium]|nr:tetratricopeptide repeat-containing glycosyltransferase family protein [Candidatus Dependentiae bacterium]
MKKYYSILLTCTTLCSAQQADYVGHIESLPATKTEQTTTLLEQAQQCMTENKHQEALRLCTIIIAQDPTSFRAHLTMGKSHLALNAADAALASFTKALNTRPSDDKSAVELGNCLLNLGNHFFGTHETEKALDAFKSILTISENFSAVHHNIAFTLAEQSGDIHGALEHYRKATNYNPNNVETRFCSSLALLASGNLVEGFDAYQTRWKRANHAPRSFSYPLAKQWDGIADIRGKRILINVEQGLGDTLQFIRYAQLLKNQGAIVIAEVQKPLADILSLCPYLDEIVTIGTSLPAFDYQIPMLNLPHVYKTNLQTIPADIPYLRAAPQLITQWRSLLAQDTNFKIGICWRGDSAHGASKFMPFNYFARLAELPGVSVYSLQKDETTNDQKYNALIQETRIKRFEGDFDEHHGRFMDTAAVIKNLDLIITVDTSIAHLAGGLGVPTWIVLPFPAEWRWLIERDDSPWYPTMRLFRQQEYNNWQGVYTQLLQALAERLDA